MKLNKKKRDGGFVVSSELMIISTVLVIGLTTGLHTLKTETNEELMDVAQAIGSVDQSYAYTGTEVTFSNPSKPVSSTAGSGFEDMVEAFTSADVIPSIEGAGAFAIDGPTLDANQNGAPIPQ